MEMMPILRYYIKPDGKSNLPPQGNYEITNKFGSSTCE